MKRVWCGALIAGATLSWACAAADTSQLWGNAGENWTAQSRLPDFSFAGYRFNNTPIPDGARVVNVRDLGAKGDGTTDDTAAFVAAIETGREGVIFIPAGRYRITKMLRVTRRGVVLQGEDLDHTTLFFPQSLTDAVGPGKDFAPGGAWSWSGGFISFEGKNSDETVASITSNARRGDDTVNVKSTNELRVGQPVRLVQTDTGGSLGKLLHADQLAASTMLKGKRLVDFACTIVAINGNRVTLNRPLRVDVRTAWKPALVSDVPSVEDVGVENLTIAFPVTRYAEHHSEPGFNAISFEQVSNAWVRKVRIVNADAGVLLQSGTRFCTVQHIELTSEPGRARDNLIGHHGILIGDLSQDNRVEDFTIRGRFIHDLCVSSLTSGNVFMDGRADDLTIDHHRKAPYENLFTNIDGGHGTNLWLSGGDEEAGPHSGARETFWNIRADQPQPLPPWAVQINFIGVTTTARADVSKTGNWVEPIMPDRLTPANLFIDQLRRRRALARP